MLICLSQLAVVAARRGDSARAGSLWGAAQRLDAELGDNLWRVRSTDHQELPGERDSAFERTPCRGLALPLDDAVEHAITSLD